MKSRRNRIFLIKKTKFKLAKNKEYQEKTSRIKKIVFLGTIIISIKYIIIECTNLFVDFKKYID